MATNPHTSPASPAPSECRWRLTVQPRPLATSPSVSTRGRYMEVPDLTRRQVLASRLRWFRGSVLGFFLYPLWRRHPEDTGGRHTVHREWGSWTVRPASGLRSWRWITPPTHAIRTIPRDGQEAAYDWALEVLGV